MPYMAAMGEKIGPRIRLLAEVSRNMPQSTIIAMVMRIKPVLLATCSRKKFATVVGML